MPRSRSSSIESSSCGRCLRGSTAPVTSRMRSASVDFPWSMWAMIEKLRMLPAGARTRSMLGGGGVTAPSQPAAYQAPDLARLLDPHREHERDVHGNTRCDGSAQAQDLHHERMDEQPAEPAPHAVAHTRQCGGGDQDANRDRDDLAALDAVELAPERNRLGQRHADRAGHRSQHYALHA